MKQTHDYKLHAGGLMNPLTVYVADKRIAELEAQLAALQWRPITAEDLPQLGDEIGQWVKQRNGPTYFEVASSVNHQDAQSLFALGWTHFRALIAPPADKAGA